MCGNTRMYWNIHVCLGTFSRANYVQISKCILLHSCIKRTLLFISFMLAHFLLEVLICHYFYYFYILVSYALRVLHRIASSSHREACLIRTLIRALFRILRSFSIRRWNTVYTLFQFC